MHYVDEVIELPSVAVHETAGERVPDRGGDRSLQIVLPTNGVRLLVLGLHDAPRTEHLQPLIVAVGAVARQIDHADGTWRKVQGHRDRVEVPDRLDLRDVRVNQGRNL